MDIGKQQRVIVVQPMDVDSLKILDQEPASERGTKSVSPREAPSDRNATDPGGGAHGSG
jgi:hypothetical protein